MIRTVDLVMAGNGRIACAAAADALQRGRRVLIVLGSGDARAGRRLRSCLCRAAAADAGQVTVMTRAEVVCVDGVGAVEAVVIRYARTGRLHAVNASAFLPCDADSTASCCLGRTSGREAGRRTRRQPSLSNG